jgi:hypothetical protein
MTHSARATAASARPPALTPPPPLCPVSTPRQHSPVVPTVEFMANKALAYLQTGVLGKDATRIWINPDCGLKTRKWEEVRACVCVCVCVCAWICRWKCVRACVCSRV